MAFFSVTTEPAHQPTDEHSQATSTGRKRRYKDVELRSASRRNVVLFVLAQTAGLIYLGWLVTAIDWSHPWLG